MSSAKEGEGLVRRYVEMRASISVLCQRMTRWRSSARGAPHTFMVCIEEVIVCIAERKLVGHGWYLVLAVVVPPLLVVGEGLYEFSLRLDGPAWR